MKLEDMINGMLLGDGHLGMGKHSKNANFCLTRKVADKEYLMWSANLLERYLTAKSVREGVIKDKRTKKEYYNIKLRTKCDVFFTNLYNKWYPNGKKIIPEDIEINWDIIKIWFADDGSVSVPKDKLNKTRFDIKFATHGFTRKEVELLKNKMVSFTGLDFRVYDENEHQSTIRLIRTDDCRKFLRSIDTEFPLKRKKDLWNNPEFRLFESLPVKFACKFCGSNKTSRNGWLRGEQKYLCMTCGRQSFSSTSGKRIKNSNGKYTMIGKYWNEKS